MTETERPDPPVDEQDGGDDDGTIITCCLCGIEFEVPDVWFKARVDDGRWWYCPNGHVQRFADSPMQELQRAVAAAKARSEKLELDLQQAREAVPVRRRPWWKVFTARGA